MTALPARTRQPLLFIGAAVLIVLFRSFVPAYYEGFYFDSDQAIVGLMARHVSTLHRFPLYYYGLNYLMGVQAWLIAPFFWIFRPSVTVMRLPLVLLNAGVAAWLIAGLGKRLRLTPAVAFVAALPFIVPTPAMSSQLLEMAGASIEPFVYVLLLWQLRRRPFAYGCVLAFGTLHREFTLFALPAMLVVEAFSGELWDRANLRRGSWMIAGFALVWLIVDDLRMRQTGASLALQVSSLGGQMCFDATLPRRIESVLLRALPAVFGGLRAPLVAWRMNSTLEIGRAWVWWLLSATLIAMLVRLLQIRWRAVAERSTLRPSQKTTGEGFGLYLAGVGALAACAYPLSCNVVFDYAPLLRYLPFTLLLPVGIFATFMMREPSRLGRALAVSVFLLLGMLNALDNGRLVVSAIRNRPESEHRMLVNYLTGHHIRYATAIYWDAYVLDFLSQERITVASSDVIRIPEYQNEVEAHAQDSVNLARLPCSGYDTVASWCIQRR
ncbi:MAG TPA: hypothetical protein VGH34_02780 [Vicinamibacterales bacterium]